MPTNHGTKIGLECIGHSCFRTGPFGDGGRWVFCLCKGKYLEDKQLEEWRKKEMHSHIKSTRNIPLKTLVYVAMEEKVMPQGQEKTMPLKKAWNGRAHKIKG